MVLASPSPVDTGPSWTTRQPEPALTRTHRSAPLTAAEPGSSSTALPSDAKPRGAAAGAGRLPLTATARSSLAPALTVASSTSETVLFGAYRIM